jgi:putative transposase
MERGSGRPCPFRTTRKESFRHNSLLKGEGGGRETEAIPCRADCGGTQAGREGAQVADLIRHLGIAEQTFYRWKQRYGRLKSDQVRQFRQLQDENTKLKRLVADLSLGKVMLQDVLSKKNLRPSQKWVGVGYLGTAYPISERRACRIVHCARASYRYRSYRDPHTALLQRMREMVQTRVRYGYRKIRVLPNREGWAVGKT